LSRCRWRRDFRVDACGVGAWLPPALSGSRLVEVRSDLPGGSREWRPAGSASPPFMKLPRSSPRAAPLVLAEPLSRDISSGSAAAVVGSPCPVGPRLLEEATAVKRSLRFLCAGALDSPGLLAVKSPAPPGNTVDSSLCPLSGGWRTAVLQMASVCRGAPSVVAGAVGASSVGRWFRCSQSRGGVHVRV
jgi:hypothetical protein